MLKINNNYKVKILNLDYKGDGVTKIDNKFVYIKGLLKDEVAIIKLTNLNRRFGVGEIVEIIEPSINRRASLNKLGSLNLYHLSFNNQLDWQKDITKETLNKVLNKNVSVLDTITDLAEFNYRNKVVYHVMDENVLKLGLYTNNNEKLVVVNDFLLANKKVNEIVKLINQNEIKIKKNKVFNLIFKNNRINEILVTIVADSFEFKGLEELINILSNISNVKGVTINIKEYREKILGSKSKVLYGMNLLKDNNLLINDQSFMQVNFGVMDLTYSLIKEHVLGPKIIDAFSGVGSIGFSLYNENYEIIMLENNLANIKLANIIKNENNYYNVKIISGNAEDEIINLDGNTVIVDPPRKGLDIKFVNALKEIKVERFIYLSCNLQTLARDLKLLENEYEIDKVYPIKMFPQTNAFETLVILNGKKR